MRLDERVALTQKTIDHFFGQEFKWGAADCGVLAATHLFNFGITSPLDQVKGYRSESGAKRALVKLRVKGMEELADAQFERIAPAAALAGDLVGFPGGTDAAPWTGLGVCVGQGFIIGFANGRVMRGPIDVCTHAWRVI